MWRKISWKEKDKKSKLILVAKGHFSSHFWIQLPFLQWFAWGLILQKIITTLLYHQILVTKTAIILRFNPILKRMVELSEQSIMEM
jgi:hypothetical protein